jgi:hypothetical protein
MTTGKIKENEQFWKCVIYSNMLVTCTSKLFYYRHLVSTFIYDT